MTDGSTYSDSTIIAQLTAYLDGELQAQEVRDVEARITNDSRYQKLLHQLQQTWDVLDVLPSAKIAAARDFTQSTMKLVVQDATLQGKKNKYKFWTWPLRILVLCLVPAAAVAGTFITSRYVQYIPVQQLAKNISVIRDLDAYSYDRNLSIEFLEDLADKDDLFGVAVATNPNMDVETAMSNSQLLGEFASLSDVQQQRIRDNFRRFQRLSAIEADRIGSLHSKIAEHENGDELLAALRRYFNWLQTLSDTEKAEIRDTADTHQRIKLIEAITKARWGEGPMSLPEKDKMIIYLGLLDIISDERIQQILDSEFGTYELMEIELHAQMFYEDSKERKIFTNGRKLKLVNENDPDKIDQLITANDVNRLRPLLSVEAREIMDFAINWSGNFDKSEAQLLVQWMVEVFNSRFSPPDAPKSIEEVYLSLTPEEQDKMDNQHPDDRKKLLEQKLQELNSY